MGVLNNGRILDLSDQDIANTFLPCKDDIRADVVPLLRSLSFKGLSSPSIRTFCSALDHVVAYRLWETKIELIGTKFSQFLGGCFWLVIPSRRSTASAAASPLP
jgi:hypothetical protein